MVAFGLLSADGCLGEDTCPTTFSRTGISLDAKSTSDQDTIWLCLLQTSCAASHLLWKPGAKDYTKHCITDNWNKPVSFDEKVLNKAFQ